jgi:aryl-alcohol dehydrogenase-like predicted oxidoreductase
MMQRRTLGGTGMSVSRFGLGAMMFGRNGNTDHDESVRIIHAALDAGINLVDTADVYSRGESEIIVGRALQGRREDVILSSKFGLPAGTEPDHRGASRRWIIRSVEGSLRRLDTDYIDVYLLHRFDPETDIDETLSTLSDLVRSGKIRAFGSSLFSADQIVEAQWCAERRHHNRFRIEQSPYSILLRGIEKTVLPCAERYGMGVMTFGPLSSGWLTDRPDHSTGHRVTLGPREFDSSIAENQAKQQAVRQLRGLADDAGLPLTHLALAFASTHPAVTTVLLGARTFEQLHQLLAGTDVRLSNDVLDRIDEIVPPGVDINRNDIYYVPSALDDPRQRRRPVEQA